MMNNRSLTYFVAVAEHRNFHRAAEALNVAQSALSKHVGQMEQEIDGLLFNRTPRGVELTPLGKSFYTEAKFVLGRFDDMIDRAKKALTDEIGQLSLGISDFEAPPLLAHCIAHFHKLHPGVELDFIKRNNDGLLKEVRAERIDAGIVLNKRGTLPDLDQIKLDTTTAMIALSERHHLALQQELSAADLEYEPFINVKTGGHKQLYFEVSSRCAAIGLKPTYVADAASERMQMWLISEEMGSGIMLASSALALPPGIVVRPLIGLDVELDISLIWSRTNLSSRLMDFTRLVRDKVTSG